jgi:hypothetical protein
MFSKYAQLWITVTLVIVFGRVLYAGEPADVPFKPTMVFRGSHSQIKEERVQKIDSAEAWGKLWKEHRGERGRQEFVELDQTLSLDFDSFTVIAIFIGNYDDCPIETVRRGEACVVRFHPTSWQIIGSFGRDKTSEELRYDAMKRESAPYAFVVLPKGTRPIIVEIGSRREIDNPIVWKHHTTFAN